MGLFRRQTPEEIDAELKRILLRRERFRIRARWFAILTITAAALLIIWRPHP
jgi:hypothetical protein